MNKTFIPQISSLRFFVAMAIVVFHYGRWSWPFNQQLISDYASMMKLGINFFFVLSGFIMAINYEHFKEFSWEKTKEFYRKRIVRIMPLYLIALIVVFLIFFFNYYFDQNILVTQFIESLFFVQAWNPKDAMSLNYVGWFISAEMFFYLLFPFIFPKIFSKKGALKQITIFWLISNLITAFLCFNLDQNNEFFRNLTRFFPLFHLNQFLIGITAGLFFSKGIKKGNTIFILSLLFLLIYLPIISRGLLPTLHHNGLLAPVFALLIIGAASSYGIIKKILSLPLFIKMGDISYGIYILQYPVYYLIYRFYDNFHFYNPLKEEGRFYIYLLILIIVAYISSKTFEPWIRKKLD
ncbi:acyltransferase [Candidatus Parcubacteria bacterium]|nr:acyltransferase [Candidatus Parcubacteria bacterium]